MSGIMFQLLVASLCIAFLSAAPTNETVSYENSSTSNPSDPHALSSVDIIVPHVGNMSATQHMSPMETSEDEVTNHHHSMEASSTESINTTSLGPLTFEDEDTKEEGSTTKATHIMFIPKKNITMQSENATDYSEEDSSSSSHEHEHHSTGSSMSSTSILLVLAVASWAVMIQ